MHLLPQHMTSQEVQLTRIQSDTTIQPSVTSPRTVSQCSTVEELVMKQLAQMKTVLSSFLRPKQETTRTTFCSYLVSEEEDLGDTDFQTLRNESVKLSSSIQSRAEERTHQPQHPQQPTLSSSSSATSIYVLLTFQQSLQVIQPAQQSQVAPREQQQPRGQPTSGTFDSTCVEVRQQYSWSCD